jgi:DnaJ-class molecular chaperone
MKCQKCNGDGWYEIEIPCPRCKGSGMRNGEICCGGVDSREIPCEECNETDIVED